MGSFFSSSSCSSIDTSINSLVFIPPITDPRDYNHVKIGDDLLSFKDNKSGNMISMIKVNASGSKKHVIFSHGNAATILGYYEFARELKRILNVNVLLYDYPGYGLSEGTPTEEGCYSSHETAVNYLLEIGVEPENITLMGQSLGTGVVIDYAAKFGWKSPIILISPYTSIVDAGVDMISSTNSCNWVARPIDKFRSLSKLLNVFCPVKIFHGTNDNVIPSSHGIELNNNLVNKKYQISLLNGIGHNDIIQNMSLNDIGEVIMHGHH